MSITIKSNQEIEIMRQSGKILAKTFEEIKQYIKVGITTKEINKIAEEYILKNEAIPSFKNYNGFPASICASINEQVVHGIPSNNKLKEGDIISIDIGVLYKGYHSDAARTYGIGTIDQSLERLMKVTEESFFEGIKYAKSGNHLSSVSGVIQDYVEKHGYSVVRDFVGHGIGKNLHESPEIPNYRMNGRGPKLEKGMTLAIEPMVNMGTEKVYVLKNKWTVVTKDGKHSSHYENTIAITDGEPEIFTI